MTTQGLPPHGGSPRATAAAINGLLAGKSNNTGTVTLAASATGTTLSDPRIGGGSVIVFMATTASAAGAAAALHVSARGKGVATLTHASDAATDQTFGYAVIG